MSLLGNCENPTLRKGEGWLVIAVWIWAFILLGVMPQFMIDGSHAKVMAGLGGAPFVGIAGWLVWMAPRVSTYLFLLVVLAAVGALVVMA